MEQRFCEDLFNYKRFTTREVDVGGLALGGNNPIRLQSMTTTDTMDTNGTVNQSIRMIEAGCEYVRITAPSIKEAKNLELIQKQIRAAGFSAPLVADIHFTPNAAEIAARIVGKVRVNPGNYADKKKFAQIDYDDISYSAELDRIRTKFTPLVTICKEYGTAMRIGTNHGSLSDRIMSRYGDTPLGMVESAMEFVRICEDEGYKDIVLSMKASNVRVMVQAYRLLVNHMMETGRNYPLHLGVTEAGEAEDGRIKSAMGIGSLLEDGLGDTVRVSLTEEPEAEIPVARKLVERYASRSNKLVNPSQSISYKPFEYIRRESNGVQNIGQQQVPVVIADFSDFDVNDYDNYAQIGYKYNVGLDKYQKPIIDMGKWQSLNSKDIYYPLLRWEDRNQEDKHKELNFILANIDEIKVEQIAELDHTSCLIITSSNVHAVAKIRSFFLQLQQRNYDVPVLIKRDYNIADNEQLTIDAAIESGCVFTDGFGDGIWIKAEAKRLDRINDLAFGILQASRTRISKTEYISCPSCGRTLFDLQETTAMIRAKTDHLKGLKIGIMGCIVNGPGEMADADYGYVGSGVGKITLYRGQEVVRRGIDAAEALDQLIEIIKEDGNWVEVAEMV